MNAQNDICTFDKNGFFEIVDVDLNALVAAGEFTPAATASESNGVCPNSICGTDTVCGNSACVGVNGYCQKNIACLDFFCLL